MSLARKQLPATGRAVSACQVQQQGPDCARRRGWEALRPLWLTATAPFRLCAGSLLTCTWTIDQYISAIHTAVSPPPHPPPAKGNAAAQLERVIHKGECARSDCARRSLVVASLSLSYTLTIVPLRPSHAFCGADGYTDQSSKRTSTVRLS